MPVALIRKGLALVELGRSADLAALIPTLQRHVAEGRSDAQQVAVVIDGAAMVGGNAAAARAALDRLEQQALNLTNPFMDYPPILTWLARHGRTAGALAALERRTELGRDPVRLPAPVAGFQGARRQRAVRPRARRRARAVRRHRRRCSRKPTRDRNCRRSCGSH